MEKSEQPFSLISQEDLPQSFDFQSLLSTNLPSYQTPKLHSVFKQTNSNEKAKKLSKQVRFNENVTTWIVEKEEDSQHNNEDDFDFVSISDISDTTENTKNDPKDDSNLEQCNQEEIVKEEKQQNIKQVENKQNNQNKGEKTICKLVLNKVKQRAKPKGFNSEKYVQQSCQNLCQCIII